MFVLQLQEWVFLGFLLEKVKLTGILHEQQHGELTRIGDYI